MPTVIRVEAEEVLGVKSRMAIAEDLIEVANSRWNSDASKDALTANFMVTHVLILLIEIWFAIKLVAYFVRYVRAMECGKIQPRDGEVVVELTDIKVGLDGKDLEKRIAVANEHCRHSMISTINDWLSNKNTPLPNAAKNDNRN